MAIKIAMTLDHIVVRGLGMSSSMVDEMLIDDKVKIFSEAMSASGLSFLNYIQAPSERGVDNG